MKSVRRQVIDAGSLPKSFNAPLSSLKKDGNPWGGKRENRLDWAGKLELPTYSEEHEYCLFTCCTTAYDTSAKKGSQKAGTALLHLLNYAAVSYGTLGTKENCCGDLADKIGAADVAADLTRKNTEMFLEAGVAKILTFSPHCLNSFKKNYDGLKNITTVHYTELLDELIQNGPINPSLRVDRKVTYHDPCYLGRHSAIYEAPRRILEAIPGIQLIEMQNNRERSFCCGGGGGGPWKDRGGKESLGEIRIKEAIGTGAGVIATACPYCIRMLNESIARLGAGNTIKVIDMAELLLQSVDLSDRLAGAGKNNIKVFQEGAHV